MTDAIADSFSVERKGNAYIGVKLAWPDPAFVELAGKGTHDQLVEGVLALAGLP